LIGWKIVCDFCDGVITLFNGGDDVVTEKNDDADDGEDDLNADDGELIFNVEEGSLNADDGDFIFGEEEDGAGLCIKGVTLCIEDVSGGGGACCAWLWSNPRSCW